MNLEPNEVIIAENKANLASGVVFCFAFLIYGTGYGILWGFPTLFMELKMYLTNYMTLAITLVGGMAAHEFLHGFTWAQFCHRGLRSIKYGIKWQALAPYAHCVEPLPIKAYRLGGIMPFIVLGVAPAIPGIAWENGWALMTAIFFSGGAAGDLIILWKLRNYGRDTWIRDHPEKIGFIVIPKP